MAHSHFHPHSAYPLASRRLLWAPAVSLDKPAKALSKKRLITFSTPPSPCVSAGLPGAKAASSGLSRRRSRVAGTPCFRGPPPRTAPNPPPRLQPAFLQPASCPPTTHPHGRVSSTPPLESDTYAPQPRGFVVSGQTSGQRIGACRGSRAGRAQMPSGRSRSVSSRPHRRLPLHPRRGTLKDLQAVPERAGYTLAHPYPAAHPCSGAAARSET